jgi:phospholipase D-like protein
VVRFLPFLISLVLSVYALFSCIQTRDEDVPYLPKLVWIVLIVFVPFVGPITWLLMSRSQGIRRDQAVQRRPKPTARPVAPDDDPDFLASLDRYRDPRTTVRPPAPDDAKPPEDKPKDDPVDEKPAKPKSQDEKPPKSKDQKPAKAKSEDEPEEAPTEPDDGKA